MKFEKQLLACAIFIFSSVFVTPLMAGEKIVTIAGEDGAIVGTINLPSVDIDEAPIMLLLHGFTGTRDELSVAGTDEGVFSRTAHLLSERGVPSLRIDFRGSGDSDSLSWEQTRFSTQIADAVAAIDFLDREFAGRDVVVLGWSQGGLVAAHAAAMRSDVDGVVLWAPVARPLQTYSEILGAEVVEKALLAEAEIIIEAVLPWGAPTALEAGFFHEFATTDPVAAMAPVDDPLLVIVGTNDTIVQPQPQMGRLFTKYHSGPSELFVLETGHAFGALENAKTLDAMVEKTLTWLEQF